MVPPQARAAVFLIFGSSGAEVCGRTKEARYRKNK
jgi:hypothetical protein